MFEEHLAQLRRRAEAGRADRKNFHEEHVGGREGEVMLAQGSKWSVATEQERAHDRLVLEETAEVSATLLRGHNAFIPPTRSFDLPTGRLGERLAVYGPLALVLVLVIREDIFTLVALLVLVTRHLLVRRIPRPDVLWGRHRRPRLGLLLVKHDLRSSQPYRVVLLFLLESQVVLDDFGVALFAESVAMPNRQFSERARAKCGKNSRVTVGVLTLPRHGRFDEVLDDVLPRLVDETVLVCVALATRSGGHVCGNVEADTLLIRFVGFSRLVTLIVVSAALLFGAVVDVVQRFRGDKESVLEKAKLGHKFA